MTVSTAIEHHFAPQQRTGQRQDAARHVRLEAQNGIGRRPGQVQAQHGPRRKEALDRHQDA